MDRKRYLGVRSWVRSGIVVLLATVLAVAALTHEQPIVGWVLVALVLLYLTLRVFITVYLIRMPADAIPPPTPASNRLLTRVRVITFIAGFGTIGVIALVETANDPDIIGGGGFVFAGAMFVSAFLFPLLVVRRARAREATEQAASDFSLSETRIKP